MQQPRRAHASTRNVAILSKVNYCSDRKQKGIKPYFFSGFDKKVIEKSPDYVKMQWRKHGFDFSHKSGIANSVLRQMRASIVKGLSVSGFILTLIQRILIKIIQFLHFLWIAIIKLSHPIHRSMIRSRCLHPQYPWELDKAPVLIVGSSFWYTLVTMHSIQRTALDRWMLEFFFRRKRRELEERITFY